MMKNNWLKTLGVSVLGCSLGLAATNSLAHEKGDLILRVGAATVAPDEDSDELDLSGTTLAGTSAGVGTDTQLGITLTYMLSDNLGLGLLAATPFEHDLKAKGAPVDGVDIGTAEHLPPTLTLQYFPMEKTSPLQPYAGIGVNYTKFFNEDLDPAYEAALGTGGIDLESSWGLSGQLGVDYSISENVLLNASVWYIDIDTEVTIDTTGGALVGGTKTVSTDVEIDPWVYMVGIGYKF